MSRDKVPAPFCEALREDAARLERHANDAASMAINWAPMFEGDRANVLNVMFDLVGSMRETGAKLRTTADQLDAVIASNP